MFYYITVTTECDLKCAYCYGKACQDFGGGFKGFTIDYEVPLSISYDVEDLGKFISKDPDPALIFYGGEPLLEVQTIERKS